MDKWKTVMFDDLKIEGTEMCASYGIGRQMGDQLATNVFEGLNVNAIAAGIADSLEGAELRVSVDKIQDAFGEINKILQAKQEKESEEAIAAGKTFLEENGKRDEVTTLESGLQYEVLEAGDADSAKPEASSTVRVHYHGTFTDGTKFDSSVDRGQPAEFPVGGVIAGWTEALQLMNKGAKWRLTIPYDLAYGPQGSPGGIPPYATLLFDVELIDIL